MFSGSCEVAYHRILIGVEYNLVQGGEWHHLRSCFHELHILVNLFAAVCCGEYASFCDHIRPTLGDCQMSTGTAAATAASRRAFPQRNQKLLPQRLTLNHKAFLPLPILLLFYTPLSTDSSAISNQQSINQANNNSLTPIYQPPTNPQTNNTTVVMSDTGRKDIHDSTSSLSHPPSHCRLTYFPEVADHATPNTAKSTTDKVTDTVSGVTDKVQR